jgi:hypothetical protein
MKAGAPTVNATARHREAGLDALAERLVAAAVAQTSTTVRYDGG